MKEIPVSEPMVLDKDIEYVTEALRTGWISSSGRFIAEFESKFSHYAGKKQGIAVNNGTNALILALKALNLSSGSEVILPTFTIISCALACIYNDLTPVFVDSEESTWNMDPSIVEKKITSKTRAILIVHTYGHPADVDPLIEIAKRNDLYVVEDFAEAIGSEYKGRICGSMGDISCASFYANKMITTGEGGMCLTDNDELAARMRTLRNLAFESGKRFYHHDLGFNFRITNLQAAIGLAQTERIHEHVEKKIWIGKTYDRLLEDMASSGLIELQLEQKWAVNTYWMYGVLINRDLNIHAEKIMSRLSEKGVQTRPFFFPMHLQPAFKGFSWQRDEKMPVSENLSEYGFYLPSGLTLTENDIEKVAGHLKRELNQLYEGGRGK